MKRNRATNCTRKVALTKTQAIGRGRRLREEGANVRAYRCTLTPKGRPDHWHIGHAGNRRQNGR